MTSRDVGSTGGTTEETRRLIFNPTSGVEITSNESIDSPLTADFESSMTIEQPRAADWIAEQAEVSPTTARSHLERLVDLHILSAVEQRGAKTYYPDAAYQRFKEVSQLIEEHTRNEIETITVTAKEDIEELRETYGVESPDELRKLATAEDTSSREAREYFEKASEWDSHLHTVSIAEEALERYEKFSDHYQPSVASAV